MEAELSEPKTSFCVPMDELLQTKDNFLIKEGQSLQPCNMHPFH